MDETETLTEKIKTLSHQLQQRDTEISSLKKQLLLLRSEKAGEKQGSGGKATAQSDMPEAFEKEIQKRVNEEIEKREKKFSEKFREMQSKYEKELFTAKQMYDSVANKVESATVQERTIEAMTRDIKILEDEKKNMKLLHMEILKQNQIELEIKYAEAKKKMLEEIKKVQHNVSLSYLEQMDNSQKLTFLRNNQLEKEIDYRSVRMEELILKGEKYESKIFELSEELESTKKTFVNVVEKNKSMGELVRKLTESFFNLQKEKDEEIHKLCVLCAVDPEELKRFALKPSAAKEADLNGKSSSRREKSDRKGKSYNGSFRKNKSKSKGKNSKKNSSANLNGRVVSSHNSRFSAANNNESNVVEFEERKNGENTINIEKEDDEKINNFHMKIIKENENENEKNEIENSNYNKNNSNNNNNVNSQSIYIQENFMSSGNNFYSNNQTVSSQKNIQSTNKALNSPNNSIKNNTNLNQELNSDLNASAANKSEALPLKDKTKSAINKEAFGKEIKNLPLMNVANSAAKKSTFSASNGNAFVNINNNKQLLNSSSSGFYPLKNREFIPGADLLNSVVFSKSNSIANVIANSLKLMGVERSNLNLALINKNNNNNNNSSNYNSNNNNNYNNEINNLNNLNSSQINPILNSINKSITYSCNRVSGFTRENNLYQIYEKKIKSMESAMREKEKEYFRLKFSFENLSEKLICYEKKFQGIITLYEAGLKKLMEEEETLKNFTIVNFNFDFSTLKNFEFNKLSNENKFNLLVFLLNQIIPLVNVNELESDFIKQNISMFKFKFFEEKLKNTAEKDGQFRNSVSNFSKVKSLKEGKNPMNYVNGTLRNMHYNASSFGNINNTFKAPLGYLKDEKLSLNRKLTMYDYQVIE